VRSAVRTSGKVSVRSGTKETLYVDTNNIALQSKHPTRPSKFFFGIFTFEHMKDLERKINFNALDCALTLPERVGDIFDSEVKKQYQRLRKSEQEAYLLDEDESDDDDEDTYEVWSHSLKTLEENDESDTVSSDSNMDECQFLCKLQRHFEEANPSLFLPTAVGGNKKDKEDQNKKDIIRLTRSSSIVIDDQDYHPEDEVFFANEQAYTSKVLNYWGKKVVTTTISPKVKSLTTAINNEERQLLSLKNSLGITCCFWMCTLKYSTLLFGMRSGMYMQRPGPSGELHKIFSYTVQSLQTALVSNLHEFFIDDLLQHRDYPQVSLANVKFSTFLSNMIHGLHNSGFVHDHSKETCQLTSFRNRFIFI